MRGWGGLDTKVALAPVRDRKRYRSLISKKPKIVVTQPGGPFGSATVELELQPGNAVRDHAGGYTWKPVALRDVVNIAESAGGSTY
jgi:hypothetical protein